MLKRLLLAAVFVVAIVAVIVVVRASLLKQQGRAVVAVTPIALDKDGAVQRFIGAIRIPTESLAGQQPNQTAMQNMRDYLQQSFPRVHAAMKREVLPDGALLFTWTGRDPSLSPVVLMGHMDVVPVNSEALGQWKHPSYSGDLADGPIWGAAHSTTRFTCCLS